MRDYAKQVLAPTEWVHDHLDDPSVRIVEVDDGSRGNLVGARVAA